MPGLYDNTENGKKKRNVEEHDTNNSIENSSQNSDEEKLIEKVNQNIKNTYTADEKLQFIRDSLQIRGKERRMLTKTFESKELLPFAQLRTLNQKDLLHSLEENDKLGIVIKDQLRVAMIDMEKFEEMVNALQEYERLLECIEEGELFERIRHRLNSDRYVEYKEGMSLLEMAGVRPKG